MAVGRMVGVKKAVKPLGGGTAIGAGKVAGMTAAKPGLRRGQAPTRPGNRFGNVGKPVRGFAGAVGKKVTAAKPTGVKQTMVGVSKKVASRPRAY